MRKKGPMMTDSVQVKIFHKTYTIKSTADQALTERICQQLDKEMQRVSAEHPKLDYQQVLLLAALNHLEALDKAEKQIQNLIDTMDDGGFDVLETES